MDHQLGMQEISGKEVDALAQKVISDAQVKAFAESRAGIQFLKNVFLLMLNAKAANRQTQLGHALWLMDLETGKKTTVELDIRFTPIDPEAN